MAEESGTGGVEVLVAEKLVKGVPEVKMVDARIMLSKLIVGKRILVVQDYQRKDVKDKFWDEMILFFSELR